MVLHPEKLSLDSCEDIMKYCKDCESFKVEYIPIGNNQMGKLPICLNVECRDPIMGEPVNCMEARKNDLFCGMKGKYWKIKEEPKEPPKGNVIQLAK